MGGRNYEASSSHFWAKMSEGMGLGTKGKEEEVRVKKEREEEEKQEELEEKKRRGRKRKSKGMEIEGVLSNSTRVRTPGLHISSSSSLPHGMNPPSSSSSLNTFPLQEKEIELIRLTNFCKERGFSPFPTTHEILLKYLQYGLDGKIGLKKKLKKVVGTIKTLNKVWWCVVVCGGVWWWWWWWWWWW